MEHNSHPQKCQHELEYCPDCDIVFCKKCKEEWKKLASCYTWNGGSVTTLPYNGDSNTSIHLC